MVGHVLRNCVGGALSMTGLQVGLMFSGVLVVEQVFGWPGIGQYIAQSIPVADFPGDRRRHADARRALRRHQHGGRPAAGGGRSTHRDSRRLGAETATHRGQSRAGRRRHARGRRNARGRGGDSLHARARRARRAGARSWSRRRAPPVCRWCSSRKCTGPAGSTSAVNSTAPKACTASRASRAPTSSRRCAAWRYPTEFHIVKRRYSGFIGTEFEIVLRGLQAVDADPHRRADRRLRALHVRRRAPARLLRPRRHRLRRRVIAIPARRGARRHGVPADRRDAHHRGDPRRVRDQLDQQPVLEGATR